MPSKKNSKLNTSQIMQKIKKERGTLKCWLDNNGLINHQQVAIKVIRNEYPHLDSDTSKKVLMALKKDGLIQ